MNERRIVYLCEYGRDDPVFLALRDNASDAVEACRAHPLFTYYGRYGDFVIRAIEVNGGELESISFGVWRGRNIIKAGKKGEFLEEWSDPEWAGQPYR